MKINTWLLGLVISCSMISSAAGHSFDLNREEVATLEMIIADLQQVQAVFIGETHDQKPHHDAQLQLIQELHKAGASVRIGLEMFRKDGQSELDRWVAGEIDEAEFSKIFRDHWSDWAMYRDIFVYARDNGIPLFGLNIRRDIISQVARSGFASLPDEQRQQLPLATCNISPQYRDFIRRTLAGHPLEGTAFDYFCEAQILWDASMAENLAAHLQQDPQQTIVVLAGNGHAWRHGIPEQLQRFGSYSHRVLLPEIRGRLDLSNTDADAADYLLQGVELGPLH